MSRVKTRDACLQDLARNDACLQGLVPIFFAERASGRVLVCHMHPVRIPSCSLTKERARAIRPLPATDLLPSPRRRDPGVRDARMEHLRSYECPEQVCERRRQVRSVVMHVFRT